MAASTKEISKLLSHVLRHAPERLELTLDANGWVAVDELIAQGRKAGFELDHTVLRMVVDTSDKKRFTLSEDGQRIRAAQGHSVRIDLGLDASEPPPALFHGTAQANLDSIFASGLNAGQRQHVHLSSDPETAVKVGARHGKPAVLRIDTGRMHQDGFLFWRADNAVWLTEHVPVAYIARSEAP